MNIMLFGTASSCSETMFVAVLSSKESPKEIISRRSTTSSSDSIEDVEDISVPSILAHDIASSRSCS